MGVLKGWEVGETGGIYATRLKPRKGWGGGGAGVGTEK